MRDVDALDKETFWNLGPWDVLTLKFYTHALHACVRVMHVSLHSGPTCMLFMLIT